MAFSNETKRQAFINACGMCEKCGKGLTYQNNGREGKGCWEAHHKTHVESGGSDNLSNCQILCWSCHEATL